MGWGCLDYFVEQPGRYTFAQAFLPTTMLSVGWKLVSLAQMTWSVAPFDPPVRLGSRTSFGSPGRQGTLFDRDIVAFWRSVGSQMADGKKNWDQTLSRDGDEYSFVITQPLVPKLQATSTKTGFSGGHDPLFNFLTED